MALYDPRSRGAEAYQDLATELLERNGVTAPAPRPRKRLPLDPIPPPKPADAYTTRAEEAGMPTNKVEDLAVWKGVSMDRCVGNTTGKRLREGR